MSDIFFPKFRGGIDPGQAHYEAIQQVGDLMGRKTSAATTPEAPKVPVVPELTLVENNIPEEQPIAKTLGGKVLVAMHSANMLRGKNDSFLPPVADTHKK